jgi:hypothetical protein
MTVRLKKLGASVSRDLDVAVAVAREEVLETHATQLLELIELSHDRVAAERITEIYVRLHRMDDPEAAVVRNRTLAALGLRSREHATAPPAALIVPPVSELLAPENGAESPKGPFRFLRERFRGRVHNELRRWIELHTGRAEMIILEVHVNNALRFVKILAEHAPIQDAVQLYREMIGARESVGQIMYWRVLERLSETDLPEIRVPSAVSAPAAVTVEPESIPENMNGAAQANRRPNGRRAAAGRAPYRTF